MGKKDVIYICVIAGLLFIGAIAIVRADRTADTRITNTERSLAAAERERDNAIAIIADLKRYNTESLERVDSLKSRQARIIAGSNAAGSRIDSIRIELESSIDLARQYEEILRGYGYTITASADGLSGGAEGSGKADIQE